MELSDIAQAILDGTIEKQWQSPAYLPPIEGEPDQIVDKFWNEYDIRTSLGMIRLRVDNPNRGVPMTKSDWVRAQWPTLKEYKDESGS